MHYVLSYSTSLILFIMRYMCLSDDTMVTVKNDEETETESHRPERPNPPNSLATTDTPLAIPERLIPIVSPDRFVSLIIRVTLSPQHELECRESSLRMDSLSLLQ